MDLQVYSSRKVKKKNSIYKTKHVYAVNFDTVVDGVAGHAPEVEKMGKIQGIIPDSIEEWRIAKAAWYYDVKFDYQVSIKGGSLIRGGQLIDFVFYIQPLEIPTQVYGEYWHPEELTPVEIQRIQDIIDEYNIPPAIIWAGEAETQTEANNIFYRRVIMLEDLGNILR